MKLYASLLSISCTLFFLSLIRTYISNSSCITTSLSNVRFPDGWHIGNLSINAKGIYLKMKMKMIRIFQFSSKISNSLLVSFLNQKWTYEKFDSNRTNRWAMNVHTNIILLAENLIWAPVCGHFLSGSGRFIKKHSSSLPRRGTEYCPSSTYIVHKVLIWFLIYLNSSFSSWRSDIKASKQV